MAEQGGSLGLLFAAKAASSWSSMGERKELEVAAGLVAGGEVLRRRGMEMRGRPASSRTSAALGGLPFGAMEEEARDATR